MASGRHGLPAGLARRRWGPCLCSVPSAKSARPREARRPWLAAAALGSAAALAALLLWGGPAREDGVTEVLAPRGELLPGRFIEVPCSEDYSSHRRFEGGGAAARLRLQ